MVTGENPELQIPKTMPSWLRRLGWLEEGPADLVGIASGFFAFLVPWILYLSTAMREPGINGDYVKFAFIGKIWGIPHSSGFPLYLILDGIVSLIPIGTLTFRVAALSALLVALAAHVLYRTARLMRFPPVLALGTALIAATGKAVWHQAVIPEVYGLHIFMIMTCVWALFKWGRTGNDRWFQAATWFWVLSLGNHLTALFALPGLIIYPLVLKPRVFARYQTWLHFALAFVVLILLYLYIFFRANLNPLHSEVGMNGSLRTLFFYIGGGPYSKQWFAYSSSEIQTLWGVFVREGIRALSEFGWFAAWIGIIAAFIRNWRRALVLTLVPAGLVMTAFIFRTVEPESYFSPAYLFMALLAGSLIMVIVDILRLPGEGPVPVAAIRSRAATWLVVVASVALTAGIAINILTTLSGNDLSGPSPQYERAKRVVGSVETPALVFTPDYTDTMLLRYVLFGDKARTDGPVATTQTWDQAKATSALSGGQHVYVFVEIADNARAAFTLEPVPAEASQPDLFELSPKPAG
jgi:hypothetical protein